MKQNSTFYNTIQIKYDDFTVQQNINNMKTKWTHNTDIMSWYISECQHQLQNGTQYKHNVTKSKQNDNKM